jgi:hypothetical protein
VLAACGHNNAGGFSEMPAALGRPDTPNYPTLT